MARGKKNWNHIKIKSLPDGCWIDRDDVLLHAAFQVLVDFVEGEKPFKHIDWTWNPEHKKARREIAKLYCWWVRIRPARVEPEYAYDVIPGWKDGLDFFGDPMSDPDGKIKAAWNKWSKEYGNYVEATEKEDQKMLQRLVQIRKYLWT